MHIFHIGVAPIFLDTISQCMMILPWFFLLSLDTLSIDSRCTFGNVEVIVIKIPIRSEKKAVKAFLEELKVVLEDEDFDIADNLLIIKSSKDEIEYSETLIDKDDDKPPLLFVFGKDINNKLIYIKLKIKGTITKKVLCLSFHYAKHDMEFPYKQGGRR